MNAAELIATAEIAERMSNDYGENPSGDRRQVRRLAKLVAELARHLAEKESRQ